MCLSSSNSGEIVWNGLLKYKQWTPLSLFLYIVGSMGELYSDIQEEMKVHTLNSLFWKPYNI